MCVLVDMSVHVGATGMHECDLRSHGNTCACEAMGMVGTWSEWLVVRVKGSCTGLGLSMCRSLGVCPKPPSKKGVFPLGCFA